MVQPLERSSWRDGKPIGRPKASDLWRTPPDFYARLDAEFRFALDAACDSDNCLAPLGLMRDRGLDALAEQWERWSRSGVSADRQIIARVVGRSLRRDASAVWCNPPYSRIRPWLAAARRAGRSVPVVMLVPADVSTKWWRDFVASDASEIRFVFGRLKFHRADGSGQHRTAGGSGKGGSLASPSAVVIYRPIGGPPAYGYMPARIRAQRGLLTAPAAEAM